MKKTLSVLLIIVLVLNILYFSLGKLKPTHFWSVIIITAVFAYFVLPRISR